MSFQTKVKLVSVESGIAAIGFRKIAAMVRLLNCSSEIYFVPNDNLYSFKSHFLPGKNISLNSDSITKIAHSLADADVICFSSMTASATYVEKIASNIKKINQKSLLIWGGIHPTLYPYESIKYVDAICIGEGDLPIKLLIEGLQSDIYPTNIPNMWFKTKNGIKKNKLLPLNSCQLLDTLPHSYNQNDCYIYDFSKCKFRSFNKFDYTNYNGLLYRTVWTRGCPFNCSYCANESFIKLDPDYRRLRYPSVNYILEEIKLARKHHPYISTIAFYDDNFIALPLTVINEFCEKYKKEINLPFVVFGFHPNLVNKEKVELLASAGMNRARMGIQSGSKETLQFYNRPTTIRKIKESSNTLADAARKYKMIPPSYDIISDNPIETNENIRATLKLIYELKRPFTLTIFSLRVFPKTQLYDYVKKHPKIRNHFRKSSYLDIQMNLNNITLYLLATFKPPKFIFDKLFSMVADKKSNSKRYPFLFYIVKSIYLIKRGIDHIYHFDFSTIVGKWTYYIWKLHN